MPKYKNIRIKKRGGGTRLQRVQVLASGKYKFVKNKATRKSSKKKSSNPKRRRTKTAKKAIRRGGKKLLGNLGAAGAVEDLAIGYFGTQLFRSMGYPTESALPMARVAQGAIGVALNRRGKGRLAYGIIDLIDVYLLKQGIGIPQLNLAAWK